jgi:hypothetical protein
MLLGGKGGVGLKCPNHRLVGNIRPLKGFCKPIKPFFFRTEVLQGLSRQLRCNGTPYREATTAGSSKNEPHLEQVRDALSVSQKHASM